VFRKPIVFSCGLETQANGQLLSNYPTNELQSLVGDNGQKALNDFSFGSLLPIALTLLIMFLYLIIRFIS